MAEHRAVVVPRASIQRQEKTDLGIGRRVVEYYQEVGPGQLWGPTLLESYDQIQLPGYAALLGESGPDGPAR